MFGKSTLLLVLGFSLIFLLFGHNFNNMATSSFDNYNRFIIDQKAYHIAVSGANMAANEVFMDNNWEAGYTDLSFDGGELNVFISNPLVSLGSKVEICHIPPGNPDNKHTIYVGASAVAAHLAHGDYLGSCGNPGSSNNIITIISEGTFAGVTKSVTVKLRPSKFSKFAYFSDDEPNNIWWTNQDTVWGPFHINGRLRVYRKPHFYGKVTISKNIKYYSNKNLDEPHFLGGFEKGIDIPMPTNGVSDLETEASNAGATISGHDSVYMNFVGDSIRYRFNKYGPDTTVLGSDFTSNGVIFVDDAVLNVSGTVKGKYSLTCSGNGSQGKGNIFLADDLVYQNDPRTNPNSQDLLGLVAEENVLIADNSNNASGDINIHASIYCEEGGFGSENYDTRPAGGNIKLLGGIIQNVRRAVGTFNYWGTVSGFNKRYRYDDRLMIISPPKFPGTGGYEIVSWHE